MTGRKMVRSDGHCFGRQQILAYSIENFISHEKKKMLVVTDFQSAILAGSCLDNAPYY